MKVTRFSIVSLKENTLDLPVTEEQLVAWKAGGLAHDVFKDCTPEQREFIMSGITPEEWNELFADSEE